MDYLYVEAFQSRCWVYSLNTKEQYDKINIDTVKRLIPLPINIYSKSNLDKALLLISLGLPHKEIEELLNDSN